MQDADRRDVKVGVIGVGGMGSFHAHTLAELAHVEIVAVADPFVANAQRVAAAIGSAALDDPLALAGDASLDAVVIASPDHTHPDLAITALEAGLWVLCEKPLATNLDEAWRVARAEAALGVRRIQLGFMREFDPAHVQLMAELPAAGPIDTLPRRAPQQQRPAASDRADHRSVDGPRHPLRALHHR